MNKFLTTLFLLCTAYCCSAQTLWTGDVSNDWHDAANWTQGVPTTGQTATIPGSAQGGVFPTVSQVLVIDFTIQSFGGSITFMADAFNNGSVVNSSGGVMTLTNGATFTNSGTVTFLNDGIFDNDGTFINYGTFNQNGNGIFNNNPQGNFINYGTIGNIGNYNNDGTLENRGNLTNSSQFVNNGLTRNYGFFSNTFVSTFTNTSGGQFINETGAQLFIDNTFNNNGQITDNGSTNVNGQGMINNNGTMDLNGLYSVGTMFNNDGTVNNSGNFKVNFGTLNNNSVWNNTGRLDDVGRLNNNAGATLNNTNVVAVASCSKMYQYSSNPVNNVTNDGVVYEIGGNVDTNAASQGRTLTNENDNPLPFVQCKDINIQLDATGNIEITPGDLILDADAKYCNIVTVAADKTTFDCTDLGPNTVEFSITDGFGGESTCNSIVTILERSPNPCNTSFLNYCTSTATNASSEFIQSVTMTSLDNNSGNDGGYADFTNLVSELDFGNFYDLTLVPGFPNNAQNVAWQVWVDWNIDGDFDDAGELVVDEISNLTVVGSVNIPGTAVPGTTRMRVSMKRNSAATACQNFSNGEVEDYTIKVNSDITIQRCPENQVVSAQPGATSAPAGWIPAKGFSTCPNSVQIALVDGLPNGSQFPLGVTTNTLEFTDGCDGVKTCSFTITVNSTPVNFSLDCPSDIILMGNADLGGAIANWIPPFPTATCPQGLNPVTQISGPDFGDFLPMGSSTQICYETSDNCGNADNCCFFIFVQDPNKSLTFNNCPTSDIVVDGQPGATGATVTYANLTTISDCPTGDVTLDILDGLPSGSFFPVGTTQVVYRAFDDCNSADLCEFNITVNSTNSTISTNCPDDIVLNAEPGAFSQVVSWPTVTASSDCAFSLVSVAQTEGLPNGSAFPVGNTVIIYAISDGCGNTEICTFNVTINVSAATLDLTCPADIDVDAAPGEVGATVTWNDPAISTDCFNGGAEATLVSPLGSGSTFPLGSKEVIYFGSDDCGNTASCSFFVNVNPVSADLNITCPSDIVKTINVNQNSTTATWSAPTTSTTCSGNVTTTQIAGPTSGSAFTPGVTTITYNASDDCGNVEICSFDVIVNVTIPADDPEIDLTCLNDISVTAAPGATSASVGFDVPTATTTCNNGGGNTGGGNSGSGGTNPPAPTSACATRTISNTVSCSGGNNYAIWLDFVGLENRYNMTNGQFVEFDNGTATLSGTITNVADATIQFQVNASFSGRTTTSPTGNPKAHSCLSPDQSNFYFYENNSGILTGLGSAAGAILRVENTMEAFQVGHGANVTSSTLDFGASGWLTIDVLHQPSGSLTLTKDTATPGNDADFNLILSGDDQVCNDNGFVDCSQAPTPGNNSVNCYDLVSNNIPGFVYMGQYGSSKYYCSETNATWENAAATAFQNGGHLAVVNNSGENNFIQNNIVADVAWIGYTDEEVEGTFDWVWGNPTYTNWLSGEPNDQDPASADGADYTAILKSDGLWRDRMGTNSYEYVMEIPANCTTPNFTLLGENGGSKYYISSANETWEQANAIAQANGFNLVTINNAAENAYLTSVTSNVVWIGFSDANSEGNFQWADGSPVTYTNWGAGQPDDWQGYGGEDYVSLLNNGTWNDENSIGQRRYVIEVACPVVTPACAAPDNVAGFTLIGEFNDSKYYIYNSATSWTTAKGIASQNGGHLATVSSQAENDFIQNNTNPASGSVWIGYNAIGTSSFSWDNGEPNSFENWQSGEPNEATNDVAARLRNDTGEWTDRVLTNSFEFIMEIPCGGTTGGCGRVTDGLQVLYDFKDGNGSVISDVSGVGSPLNLTIANTNNTNWLSGGCGLSVNAGTIAKTSGAASKIIAAVKASHEITMEAWVKPANTTQNGPARISTISSNTSLRNATLGQEGSDYAARLRTTSTTNNGVPNALGSGLSTSLQHVVYTRNASGVEKMYVNGAEVYSGTRAGDMSNWDNNYQFALFNELTNDRNWLGEMYLSAVYSKALSAAEVSQNYSAGECCGGNGGSGEATVAQIAGNAPNTDFPVGTTTVIYEATDDCGNAAYCSFDVTVLAPATNLSLDNCPTDITVQTAAGEDTAIVTWTAPTATSDCATGDVVVSQIAGFASGSGFPTGVTTVTYRAVDGCGNEQLCSFFVTVEGTPAPPTEITVDCVENFTIQTAAGANSALASWIEPTGTTTCEGSNVEVIQIGGLPNGGNFPIGTTVIFYRLEDDCGNVASCAFNVTVQAVGSSIDIICPPNVSVNAEPDADYGVATFAAATATSTCFTGSPNVGQIAGLPSGSLFPVGNSVVFFRATDDCGNVDVCNFVVTVNATPITNIDPCINDGGDSDNDGICDDNDVCPGFDDTADADGDGTPDGCDACPNDAAGDSDGDGVCDSDDICEGSDDNIDTDGDGAPDGCDVCPADANDDSDGDGVCDSQDVCPDFDDNADADGDGTPDGCDACPNDAAGDSDGDGVCDSDDICEGSDDNIDTDGDGAPDGCDVCPADANDDSDGDGVCDSQDICPGFDDNADADGDGIPDGCDNLNCACEVDGDTSAPALQGVPADMIVECDAVPTAPTVTAVDECTPNIAVTFDEITTSGVCPNSFSIERTWTATDDCGNTRVKTQTITVNDNEGPIVTNPPSDVTVAAGENSGYQPIFTDNCGDIMLVNLEELFMLPDENCNEFYTILSTWSAFDACGNQTQVSQLVTYLDDTYLVDDDNDGVCNADDICPGFDDNEDLNNNGIPDGCEGAITITSCPDFISYGIPFNNPQDGDDVSWTEPTATTSCPDGGLTITQTEGQNNGSFFLAGTVYTITYLIEDACGNTATCSFEISLGSEVGFTFCPNDINLTTNSSGAIASWTEPNPESSCGATGGAYDQSGAALNGTEFPIGTTEVIYLFTDGCGNQAQCSFDVTVTSTACDDDDNDGVCNEDDQCEGFDDNIDNDNDGIIDGCDPCITGATCDDGDANTENDVFDENCNCAGTPINGEPDCDNISITVDGSNIIVTNLNGAPISSLQIFNSSWGGEFNCFQDCNDTEIVPVTPGTYYVYAKYYESNYQLICQNVQTVEVTDAPCDDDDNDGVCNANDVCPGFDDNIDSDNDGIPDGCEVPDCTPGNACDDGDVCTYNDTYDLDCNCVGTAEADSDGDGVCDPIDQCEGFDDNIDNDNDGIIDGCDPCQTGDTCDDGDANTENDVLDENCDCAGTPIPTEPDCDNISITAGANSIIVTNLGGAPISSLQIFNSNWQGEFSCFADCSDTETVSVAPGTYYVYAKYYESNYQPICQNVQTIVVTDAPCDDDDNDGVCNDLDECEGFDDSIDVDNDGIIDGCDPCITGATCDDGDANTDNDVFDENCNCAGTPIACDDDDNDGVCNEDDQCEGFDDSIDVDNDGIIDGCDPCITGATCDDGDANTDNDVFDENCNCAGTPIGCDDDDNDGVCNEDDQCEGFDDSIDVDNDGIIDGCDPCITGAACDDGDANTDNDVFDENCNCAGTPIGCDDDDNDGVCNEDDQCEGFDDSIDVDNDGIIDGCDPCITGATCDDGDANTDNDVFDENCNCAGTPISGEPDCDNISISVVDGNIVVTNLDGAPISSLQIFNASWGGEFSCFQDCNDTETVAVTPGTYYVYAKYYESNYQVICQNVQTVTVTNGGGGCTDADGDGYCEADDCDDNDATIPAAAGTACDDGDAGTTGDQIQADGCTCEGTPANPNDPNCADISISVVGGDIVVTNLDGAPVSSLQILNSSYQTEFACFGDCQATENVSVVAGTYYVYAKYYDASYQQICENVQTVNVTANLIAGNSNMDFQAQKGQLISKLYWSVANDENVSHYEVETSTDGLHFTPLTEVISKQSATPSLYHFDDVKPAFGANYYRIQTVDFDGNKAISKVRRLNFNVDFGDVVVFPNPAKETVNVSVKDFAGKAATVVVYDLLGKVVYQQKFLSLPSVPMELNLTDYRSGVYHITVAVEGYRLITKKLVVQE